MNVPSPLLDRLAQLLVLYEHLRIENIRRHRICRRGRWHSMLPMRGIACRILSGASRMRSWSLTAPSLCFRKRTNTDPREANFEKDRKMKNLMATVSSASRRLDALHEALRSFGEFDWRAARR